MDEIKKLDLKSKEIVSDNIEYIVKKFPNVLVETKDGIKINFDLLSQELSNDIVEGQCEKYQLSWPGKKAAIIEANTPITLTLRAERKKSVEFEKTKNIYIEGDNLEVLKILQESYINKIKCIYIDPPYNTGNDFVYNDKFSKSNEIELLESGQIDQYNNRLIANNNSNGRFHSDWLSMMYSRLKLAKNLLTNDGVIYISIDENEEANMIKIAEEIFGENNYIGSYIWVNRTTPNDPKLNFASSHEYILIFAKNIDQVKFKGEEKDLSGYKNPDNDPNGAWISDNPSAASGNPDRDRFEIVNPYTGQIYLPPQGRYWAFSEKRVKEWFESGKLVFPKENNKNFLLKKYRTDLKSESKPVGSIITGLLTSHGTKEIKELFDEDDDRLFSYPKPSELIVKLLEQIDSTDGIYLDFFSGSATTANAILKLNSMDNGKRQFIMVQIPEKVENEKYKTICEIGEERIRRASEKIKKETNAKIDYGFRVYKVDSSNMKDVYYSPSDVKQQNLFDYVSNIKEDRIPDDLLVQVILDLGLTLDLKMEEKNILNNKVYFVDENSLIACFDNEININVVDEICKYSPLKVVFKDESFKFDNDKINLQERFKKLSPNTEICIL